MTAGVLVFLYVGWQVWVGDLIYGAEANAAGQELSEEWARERETTAPEATPTASTSSAPDVAGAEPVILPQPADAETFAILYIPRFGAEYAWKIAGGVTPARTLNTFQVGHYPDAAMPGEAGNFALAGHRTTYGAPFGRLADLRIGDAIVVETQNGWYTYRFRNMQYVTPRSIDVLLDVPQQPNVPAGDRYITLTSCSPKLAMTERIIGYGLFESYTPHEAGPPTSLAEVNS
jgi:sortase A